MIQSNLDFMNGTPGRCEICGGEDCGGRVLSELRLFCGYGSRYDGERVSLNICGDCCDKILELIQKESK